MDRLSIPEQLEDLRQVSGLVDDYLTRELYVADFGADTGYSPNQVLVECYNIIIEELTEFGVSFYVDDSDLLQDWYTAKEVYYLRAFLDSDHLLRVLSVRGGLDQLAALLDTDTLDDVYQIVIDFVFNRRESEIYTCLTDLADRVRIDDKFIQHLTACIARIRETGSLYNIPEEEMPYVQAYIAKVNKDRQVVSKGYDYLLGIHPYSSSLVGTTATELLRNYDVDKTLPTNLRRFAMLDRDDTLDPIGRKRLVDHHHATTPYHAEYYLHHPDELDEQRIIFVHLALLEPDGTSEGYTTAAANTLSILRRVRELSPDTLAYISKLTSVLAAFQDEVKACDSNP